MGEVSYIPLIEDMTWSYSRLKCFEDCKHRWMIKYIRNKKPEDRYYASFGIFVHRLLEKYYNGKLNRGEMLIEFLTNVSSEVRGERPQPSTVEKHISATADYFRNFKPFDMNVLAVEEEMRFEINGNRFVGYADFIGEKDGDIYLIDNKSRDLKPRSGRAKPTLNDKAIDEMLRQLYLYSAAVKKEYGSFPKFLCFNCFRTGTFIQEAFDYEKYLETIQWVEETIEKIKSEECFDPSYQSFICRWICDVNYECEEYQETLTERRKYY